MHRTEDMLRILTGISILWFLIPGYAISLIISFFVPPIYTGAAFDSGGVASGPMTTTFLLPFAVGACEAMVGNILTDAMSFYLYHNPTQIAWIGDYAKDAEMYDKCWRDESSNEFHFVVSDIPFDYTNKWLVNHTTKEAFAMDKPDDEDWVPYPVSLLTACGNGLGGGDYYGASKAVIGIWAMHVLSIEDAVPTDYSIISTIQFE